LNPVGSTLRGLCNAKSGADEARLAQCAAIATTMFEHTDSQDLRVQAANLTRLVSGDSTRVDTVRMERQRMQSASPHAPALSTCGESRWQMRLLLRSSQVGEVQARREMAASAPALP